MIVFFVSVGKKLWLQLATYSFHRLVMGKEELGKFSVSMGIFGFLFYRNVYWVVLYVS